MFGLGLPDHWIERLSHYLRIILNEILHQLTNLILRETAPFSDGAQIEPNQGLHVSKDVRNVEF